MAPSKGTTQPSRDMTPKQRLESFLFDSQRGDTWFMGQWLHSGLRVKEVELLSSTHGKATFTFNVQEFYCNRSGNLHGGAQSTIFDICTSIVLAAMDNQDLWINGGVSRSLEVTYLRPAPEGEIIDCVCEVVHAAKRLALLKGELRRQSDGAVVSTCKHDKAAVPVKAWKL